jgi:hypothetical protein
MSTISFADQMPNLLHSKDVKSEYSYFDLTKLKLFAGPNIWKYTNLLNSTITANPSIIQQQQAPAIRQRINSGPKRSFRVDVYNQISIDQIMLNVINGRDKKSVGISQSALILRIREKSLNQMQLARKLRPLTDLINSHNFPELNFEYLQRREQQQQQIEQDDFDDHDFPITNDHDEGKTSNFGIFFVFRIFVFIDAPLVEMHYDFIRPIHYEKIEFAKGSTSVNAKNLKRQMIEEFTRQQRTLSLDTTTSSQQSSQSTIEFSILCENLADHGYLSLQTDLASAFYCMLINCNENKLYMKNNSKRDDLFIQERPFIDQRDHSTLSYSYTSSSNLSTTSLIS